MRFIQKEFNLVRNNWRPFQSLGYLPFPACAQHTTPGSWDFIVFSVEKREEEKKWERWNKIFKKRGGEPLGFAFYRYRRDLPRPLCWPRLCGGRKVRVFQLWVLLNIVSVIFFKIKFFKKWIYRSSFWRSRIVFSLVWKDTSVGSWHDAME